MANYLKAYATAGALQSYNQESVEYGLVSLIQSLETPQRKSEIVTNVDSLKDKISKQSSTFEANQKKKLSCRVQFLNACFGGDKIKYIGYAIGLLAIVCAIGSAITTGFEEVEQRKNPSGKVSTSLFVLTIAWLVSYAVYTTLSTANTWVTDIMNKLDTVKETDVLDGKQLLHLLDSLTKYLEIQERDKKLVQLHDFAMLLEKLPNNYKAKLPQSGILLSYLIELLDDNDPLRKKLIELRKEALTMDQNPFYQRRLSRRLSSFKLKEKEADGSPHNLEKNAPTHDFMVSNLSDLCEIGLKSAFEVLLANLFYVNQTEMVEVVIDKP